MRRFFGRRRQNETDEEYSARLQELDKVWENLMEQQYLLKEYGHLSLFEQAQMTAEERSWFLKRVKKEIEERNKKEQEASSGVSRPSMPSMPSGVSMPSISMPSINIPSGAKR